MDKQTPNKTKKKKNTNNKTELKLTNFNQETKKNSKKEYNEEFISASAQDTIKNFKKVEKIIYEEKKNAKKNKAKKKKKNKVLRICFIIVITLIVILIIMAICMITLPIFNLRNITISGTDKYDKDKVAETINLKQNENVFISMFKSNKERIKNEFPYIDSISYKYKFPDSIEIKTVERKNYYYSFNKENSKYYMLDKNGYILSELEDSSMWDETTILVSGITFENKVILGEKINEIDLNKLNKFDGFKENLLQNIPNSKITRVIFENHYMTIYINSAIEVVFEVNKEIEDYNLSLLKLIMKDVESQQGIIDMTKENPTFVKK